MSQMKEETVRKGKYAGESSVVMAQVMNPLDANPAGNVHGGAIMKLIDTVAGAVAVRHARTNVVTASIDRLDFHSPVFIGDLLTLKAGLNMVGRTSMEVGVRVETENLVTGKVRHTASAYLTMVALGPDGRPKEIVPLILETDEQVRRNREAEARRRMRLEERQKEKACQENHEKCEF
ncbi:MAG: acyl-CoA thioesterase [Deltaproteobacteria bacterium]|nr:acyl-CoA thioesterase [Deltaproteobacteria bacterium]